ncbi:MAG TPA: M20/M25/M40 family metallo-hydrolase [Candidatus Acidoferrales bacterium]|nr:M20/M25/M40 family metallo-hydrolase [Candidatus Acidoferrales bacterium]
MRFRTLALSFAVALFLSASLVGQQNTDANKLAHDIYKQLIETNTTESVGNMTTAADEMAARLRAAGFPASDVVVLGQDARHGNIVARIHGTSEGNQSARKPILFLAHLDVVEANRSDWSIDPFKLTEKDGFFYGRGTSDVKDGDAILVTNFIRLKQEGYKPDRDLILALTSDEEGGDFNGVSWLLATHRDLIDAEYCINTDGGDFQLKDGKPLLASIQTSEKIYADFQLQVRNKGGHSSLPVPDNAIYHLANGLARLAKYQFPVQLNETTRAFFERMAIIDQGPLSKEMKGAAKKPPNRAAIGLLSASPYYNALLRTTCVATRLDAGHANNALPQDARAIVNCRILPGGTQEETEKTLVRVLGDPQIKITPVAPPHNSPASPLRKDVLQTTEQAVKAVWPGVPVVPVMDTGASDGYRLRAAGIPTYGVSGVFIDMDDVRAHGRDERILETSFYQGVDFFYLYIKALSSGN